MFEKPKNRVKRKERNVTTNLPASDGIIADLPPIHPTSSNSSLGFINSGSLGSNSHLLRPRSGMGGPIARPLSIADGGLSLPSPDVGVCSIFQTMPSSMRSKRKVLSPPEQHLEEEFPSAQICTSEESGDPFCPRTLRGQSEGPPEFKRLSATPEAPPRGHYPGRNFNDDSEDEAITEEIFDVASRFQSAPAVLANPALCSVLINYLLCQNRELSPILFYLAAKHYAWVVTTNKSLATSDRRFLIEIFSTFLHEKSPLPVKVDPLIIQQMEETILSNSPAMVFDGCCDDVLPQIQFQLEKLNKDIRYGLDIWKPVENFDILIEHTPEEELGIFEGAITPCLLELERIIADGSAAAVSVSTATNGKSSGTAIVDLRNPILPSSNCATWVAATAKKTNYSLKKTALALKISLVTAYWYFKLSKCTSATDTLSTSGSIDESCIVTSPSTPINLQPSRKSYLARSIENLAAQATGGRSGASSLNSHAFTGSLSSSLPFVGTIKWHKMPCFNSKIKTKTPSAALFGRMKSTTSVKGHNLQERCFERIAECAVCEELLWGLAPQGLSCQNCDLCAHQKCKSNIKDNCQKDNKTKASSSILTANSVCSAGSSGFSSLRLSSSRSTIYGSLNFSSVSAASQQAQQQQQQSDQASSTVGPSEEKKASLAASTEEIHHCRNHSWGEVFQPPSINPSSGFVSVTEPAPIPEATSPADLTALSNTGRSNRVNIGYSQSISYRRSDGLKSPEFALRKPKWRSYSHGGSHGLRKLASSASDILSSARLEGHIRQVKQPYEGYISGSENRLSKHATSTLSLLSPSEQEKRGFTSSVAENMQKLCPFDWSEDQDMKEQESFDAMTELRTHFPNYEVPTKGPRVQDHVRTLVLLEFHQKVRYMVSYLKQFDYLLIRPWPTEHKYLREMLCLEHIPLLIGLFQSLVTVIESTVEPQGYGDLASAVLEWLTVNNGENLKAWSRHCQALSCTNMLDCVKAARREYARKNPRIQPLLETRFNKFVLIDGLTQMRVLYFNLPLIVKNITKDLEKKTTKYKEEAKVWQEIYVKLSGLPYTIDTVCMPLVKLINNGQFYSTVDKKEQLTRHQAQGGTVPFSTLLLEFPRTLFQYYVVDHAEVTVDKFTFTSENKINYDYLREKTDVLAILLEDALLLLIKEGDRFVMRPFKPTKEQGMGPDTPTPSSTGPGVSSFGSVGGTLSQLNPGLAASNVNLSDRPSGNTLGNTMKLLPVFPLDSVFTSRGENIGGEYMLNMIFKKLAVLLRIFFTKKDLRERWYHTLKALEDRVTSGLYSAHHFDQGSRAGSCCPSERSSISEILHSRENSGELQESKPPPQPEELSEIEEDDIKASADSAETLESCQVAESCVESFWSSEEIPNEEGQQLAEECNRIKQRIMDLVKSIDNDDTSYDVQNGKEPLKDKLFSNRQRLVCELILTTKWLDFIAKRLHGSLNASTFAAHEKLSHSFSWEPDSTDSNYARAAVSVATKAHCRPMSTIVETDNISLAAVQFSGLKRPRSKSAFVGRFGNLKEDIDKDEDECSVYQGTMNEDDLDESKDLRDLQILASLLSQAAHRALRSATSKSEGEEMEAGCAAGDGLSLIKQEECALISVEAQKEDSASLKITGNTELKSSDLEGIIPSKEIIAKTMEQEGDKKDENDADAKLTTSISAVSVATDIIDLPGLHNDKNDSEEQMRKAAQALCDEIINGARSFEEEVEATATDLVDSVLIFAYDRLTGHHAPSSVTLSTMDSGMGSLLEQSTVSNEEQGEFVVPSSTPRMATKEFSTNSPRENSKQSGKKIEHLEVHSHLVDTQLVNLHTKISDGDLKVGNEGK
uniref:Phorbol-ester/DAG-type domain-containing protein n=1 Tax=Schistocephalus solidus TaxID=70667 RepID=A0A0X3PTQ9_SCHSO